MMFIGFVRLVVSSDQVRRSVTIHWAGTQNNVNSTMPVVQLLSQGLMNRSSQLRIYPMKKGYRAFDHSPHIREVPKDLLWLIIRQIEGGPERIKQEFPIPADYRGDKTSLRDYIVRVPDDQVTIVARQSEEARSPGKEVWLRFLDTRLYPPSETVTVVLQAQKGGNNGGKSRQKNYDVLAAYLGAPAPPGTWDKKAIEREAKEISLVRGISLAQALSEVIQTSTDFWAHYAYRLGSKAVICTGCNEVDIAREEVLAAWDGARNILCPRCEELSKGGLARMKGRSANIGFPERPVLVKLTHGIHRKRTQS